MGPTNCSSDRGQGPSEEPRLLMVIEYADETRYTFQFAPSTAGPGVEHDRQKQVFRITEPDGKTAVFRDEPVRLFNRGS